jgi:hypothetical protein
MQAGPTCDSRETCGTPTPASSSRPNTPPVTAKDLADVTLIGPWPSKDERRGLQNSSLQEGMTVVFVVRRLGCPFCRAPVIDFVKKCVESSVTPKIMIISSQEKNAGGFLDTCFSTYVSKYDRKKVDLFVDKDDTFKKALGYKKLSLLWMLKPSVLKLIYSTKWITGDQSDATDQKTSILGGEFIFKDGEVKHSRIEGTDFTHTPTDELFDISQRYS